MLRRLRQCPLSFLWGVFFIILIGPLTLSSATASDYKLEDPKKVSYHISALKVSYDNVKNLYIAEGDVVITGGKSRLEADYVEFSNQTKDAKAKGNVLLISGGDSIACRAMEINLATQIGTIHHGAIYIQKNNFYIHGDNIRKTGKFTYTVDEGSITSCAGDSPDWKITARDIEVTIEGYGNAKHAKLYAKQVPVFYSPFVSFPVKTKRQSGLLTPRYASSDRKGYELELPLFFAISRNTDATFTFDYMMERGLKGGAEFRYILDNSSKGSMYFDFLEDDKTDDGTSATNDYRYFSTPQRTNSDRWWFRMKHNQDLPKGFKAKLDIDFVSDADYLLEFKDGYSGYDKTKEAFEETFGRSLDEYNDTTRKNKLTVNKIWSTYNLNMTALWYDNIVARREDTDDTTLQTLPSIEFDISKNQIGSSKFYYKLNSEFRSFYRQDTTDLLVNGQRTDIYPKLFMPVRLGKAFLFEPSLGVRGTAWNTKNFEDINGDNDDLRFRGLYDIGAELSTKIFKVYSAKSLASDKIKHEIIPKLSYEFLPNVIQNDLPVFDAIDQIDEMNQVTWTLINRFTSRKSVKTREGAERFKYDEFIWIKLFQSYDIKKERDNTSEPFTDITLESEINPVNYVSLNADIDWSPYDYHFNTLNIAATLKDNRGDKLRAEYRYTIDNNEYLYSKLDAKLTRELAAFCSYEKNLNTDKRVETVVGLEFKRSCWSVSLAYSDAPDEKKVGFLINLYGIGELGTK